MGDGLDRLRPASGETGGSVISMSDVFCVDRSPIGKPSIGIDAAGAELLDVEGFDKPVAEVDREGGFDGLGVGLESSREALKWKRSFIRSLYCEYECGCLSPSLSPPDIAPDAVPPATLGPLPRPSFASSSAAAPAIVVALPCPAARFRSPAIR
jgi:hypothetical protein